MIVYMFGKHKYQNIEKIFYIILLITSFTLLGKKSFIHP